MAAPTITGLTPIYGPVTGGTVVTVTGTNFNVAGLQVFFGDVLSPSFSQMGGTTITATSPPSAVGQNVVYVRVVTNDGDAGQVYEAQFSFLADEVGLVDVQTDCNYFDLKPNYTMYGKWKFAQPPFIVGGSTTGITGGVNLGTGDAVFTSVAGSNMQFRTIVGGVGMVVTPSGTEILLEASGSFDPASNQTITGDWNFTGDFDVASSDPVSISSTGNLVLTANIGLATLQSSGNASVLSSAGHAQIEGFQNASLSALNGDVFIGAGANNVNITAAADVVVTGAGYTLAAAGAPVGAATPGVVSNMPPAGYNYLAIHSVTGEIIQVTAI